MHIIHFAAGVVHLGFRAGALAVGKRQVRSRRSYRPSDNKKGFHGTAFAGIRHVMEQVFNRFEQSGVGTRATAWGTSPHSHYG